MDISEIVGVWKRCKIYNEIIEGINEYKNNINDCKLYLDRKI